MQARNMASPQMYSYRQMGVPGPIVNISPGVAALPINMNNQPLSMRPNSPSVREQQAAPKPAPPSPRVTSSLFSSSSGSAKRAESPFMRNDHILIPPRAASTTNTPSNGVHTGTVQPTVMQQSMQTSMVQPNMPMTLQSMQTSMVQPNMPMTLQSMQTSMVQPNMPMTLQSMMQPQMAAGMPPAATTSSLGSMQSAVQFQPNMGSVQYPSSTPVASPRMAPYQAAPLQFAASYPVRTRSMLLASR
jgi:hypothetical protein